MSLQKPIATNGISPLSPLWPLSPPSSTNPPTPEPPNRQPLTLPPHNPGFTFTPTLHHDTYPLISPSSSSAAGLHIFITGASKGIGRATALSYAKAGAAAIGLGARSDLENLAEEIRQLGAGTKVVCVKLDVSDRASVEAAAGVVQGELGWVDVLVNNAGYLEEFRAIGESDPEGWWRTWEVVCWSAS